eukprot:TRINITY_DN14567_c0_g1_i1.p1 TRINITY_DN14567_c0_g1~~TRINITY_DN14567_c0_g1_i1.p1  ORF type:complete len:189 (+),score=20.87 TRINITY_DN14567_c0_g1_i1:66-632(+)
MCIRDSSKGDEIKSITKEPTSPKKRKDKMNEDDDEQKRLKSVKLNGNPNHVQYNATDSVQAETRTMPAAKIRVKPEEFKQNPKINSIYQAGARPVLGRSFLKKEPPPSPNADSASAGLSLQLSQAASYGFMCPCAQYLALSQQIEGIQPEKCHCGGNLKIDADSVYETLIENGLDPKYLQKVSCNNIA